MGHATTPIMDVDPYRGDHPPLLKANTKLKFSDSKNNNKNGNVCVKVSCSNCDRLAWAVLQASTLLIWLLPRGFPVLLSQSLQLWLQTSDENKHHLDLTPGRLQSDPNNTSPRLNTIH